jgi:crossover junction endodeoxyribonuclease RuvC
MRVLGIDPGTASTGYGVVDVEGSRMRAVDHGVIATAASMPLEQRLAVILERLQRVLAAYQPDAVALEDLFVGANPRTVLSVGHARGAVLAACGMAGVSAHGYPPAEVKAAVCGYGRAEKGQVQRMVSAMLSLDVSTLSDHATDALGVAICHAVRSRGRSLLATGRG